MRHCISERVLIQATQKLVRLAKLIFKSHQFGNFKITFLQALFERVALFTVIYDSINVNKSRGQDLTWNTLQKYNHECLL